MVSSSPSDEAVSHVYSFAASSERIAFVERQICLEGLEWRFRKTLEAGEGLALQELREEMNKQWQGINAHCARRCVAASTARLLQVGQLHQVKRLEALPLELWIDRARVRRHIEDYRKRESELEQNALQQTNSTIYNHIEQTIKKDREKEITVLQRECERTLVKNIRQKLHSLEAQDAKVSDTKAAVKDTLGEPSPRNPERVLQERLIQLNDRRKWLAQRPLNKNAKMVKTAA